jgi:selenocysteine lyase/cysteine desulfurase
VTGQSSGIEKAYLNNAATSYPKPPSVAEAVYAALQRLPGAANRGGIDDFDVMGTVRQRLAPVLGVADSSRIALGPNATWALNLAVFGLGLRAGDWVVTTKAEHNSVLRPLYALKKERGVEIIYIDTDRDGLVLTDDWEEQISFHRPRLCVFSHASNVTGAVNDASRLTAIARGNRALTLIDLAQTLGWVDVRLEAWGADLAAFTGHKYLLGPQGIGGLYVRGGLELRPHLVGGTGIHSELDTMPPDMPLRLEAGTGNEPSAHGLLAALAWAAQNPLDAGERDRVSREVEFLRTALLRLRCKVANPDPSGPCTPVISFSVEGMSANDVGGLLLDCYDIIVRTGLHCAPRVFECLDFDPSAGTVRASLSRFTTHEEVVALIEAVKDIIASGCAS